MRFTLLKQCPDELIKSAPFENVTVPLGQTTPVNFSCDADGDFVLWAINGTYHHLNDPNIYQNRVTFYPDVQTSSGFNISMGINVTILQQTTTQKYIAPHLFLELLKIPQWSLSPLLVR